MKKSFRLLLVAAMSCLSFSAVQGAEYQQHADGLQTIPTKAPAAASAANFTGAVMHQSLFQTTADTTYTGSYVTFAPGARTFWHTHPGGQRLVVIKGTCWTQTENGSKTIAHAGDTIWCPPDVKHWHGASPDSEMTHLALTEVRNGKNVTWMEPVSDEQYYSK
ncbi:cupin domain-containing protein [Megasphaera sp. SW808]|uniref:(R)-mandelonitrile lyase n=1 Tax=Megasphaera sp. SW808 TaxID=2530045 RepID=UPI00197E36BE|nr:cupin domain-containing protein [Megasphaera sp. SW808]